MLGTIYIPGIVKPVWPGLPGLARPPPTSRRYVLIVWYANVKIQTHRERDWFVFSHGSLRSLIEVSANIILELSASQEIRQLTAWARHPRFTIEVKFWLKGRTEDCVRDRNNKSSVLRGCKNYCEINQPLRDYSGNNKEQELGMINEYRDCNQYFFHIQMNTESPERRRPQRIFMSMCPNGQCLVRGIETEPWGNHNNTEHSDTGGRPPSSQAHCPVVVKLWFLTIKLGLFKIKCGFEKNNYVVFVNISQLWVKRAEARFVGQ